MTITVSPTEADVETLLRAFLTKILPAGTPIVRGQTNRVPTVAQADYVVYWPITRPRLTTNVQSHMDSAFTASISGTAMAVTALATIKGQASVVPIGAEVFGVGVADGTLIAAQVSGAPGGIGVYTVSPSQTVAPATLSAGQASATQSLMATFQIDVHGPASSDNATTISTLFRDPFATRFFAEADKRVSPLYTDDPHQVIFSDDQQQVEDRWMVSPALQVDVTASGLPQEFASAISVRVVNVDAAYPP